MGEEGCGKAAGRTVVVGGAVVRGEEEGRGEAIGWGKRNEIPRKKQKTRRKSCTFIIPPYFPNIHTISINVKVHFPLTIIQKAKYTTHTSTHSTEKKNNEGKDQPRR